MVIFNKAKEEENTMQSYESALLGEKENLARKTSCKTDFYGAEANVFKLREDLI